MECIYVHGCRLPHCDSHIHDLLHHIIHNQEIIMSTVADLDTSIGTVESTLTKLGTDLQNALNDLIAKVSAAPPQTFDPAPEIARLQAVATKLTSLDTAAVTDDPGAPTPTPTLVATTTTLEVGTAAGPLTAGAPIPLQGTVVGGTTNPSGTVAITDSTGAVSLTASLDSTGAFVATTPGLPAGSYSLTAAYSGDAANAASSGTLSITVSAAAA